jgi:hypothetical protein
MTQSLLLVVLLVKQSLLVFYSGLTHFFHVCCVPQLRLMVFLFLSCIGKGRFPPSHPPPPRERGLRYVCPNKWIPSLNDLSTQKKVIC